MLNQKITIRILALIALIDFSCDRKLIKIKNKIVNKDSSTWVLDEYNGFSYKQKTLFFVFKKSGECNYYLWNSNNNLRERFFFGDVISNNRWELIGSNIIQILNSKLKILSISDTLLKLQNLKDSNSILKLKKEL